MVDLNHEGWKIVIAALRHTAECYAERAKTHEKIIPDQARREMGFAQACGGISDVLDREIFGATKSPLIIRH